MASPRHRSSEKSLTFKININRIHHQSNNCNNWIKKDFENICTELGECPLCASIHSFSFKRLEYVWKWDVSIPQQWQYGDWESIKLFPVHVPLPIVRCEACGKYFRVEPEFLIKGTILTVPALVFVVFTYP
ncbi:MAG: hypothetical protein HPY74_19080 [Firmicutes bacterium]|nr:hypothetical protein [Bacillota bacterium]